MEVRYECPVCGYPDMKLPVEEGNLCPCCGTEFGYEDSVLGLSYQEIRDRWVADGPVWFSQVTPEPHDWDGIEQLTLANLEFEAAEDEESGPTAGAFPGYPVPCYFRSGSH